MPSRRTLPPYAPSHPPYPVLSQALQRTVELDDAAARLATGAAPEARRGLRGLWEGARSAPLPGDPVWVWDDLAEVRRIALKTCQVQPLFGPLI